MTPAKLWCCGSFGLGLLLTFIMIAGYANTKNQNTEYIPTICFSVTVVTVPNGDQTHVNLLVDYQRENGQTNRIQIPQFTVKGVHQKEEYEAQFPPQYQIPCFVHTRRYYETNDTIYFDDPRGSLLPYDIIAPLLGVMILFCFLRYLTLRCRERRNDRRDQLSVWLTFLMGTHRVMGVDSSIQTLTRNNIYDKQVLRLISGFLDGDDHRPQSQTNLEFSDMIIP